LHNSPLLKKRFYFLNKTHSCAASVSAGALLNAASVVEGIRSLEGCSLKTYLLQNNDTKSAITD